MSTRVILAGGSGFLGRALGRRLRERGHEVVILTRAQPRTRADGVHEVQWDGHTADGWEAALEGAHAVVNLAGRSINCLHTEANRRTILGSRIDSIRALAEGIAACKRPPSVWVQASAVGYYGHAEDRRCAEETQAGTDVLAGICLRWEQAFATTCPSGVRPVLLRLGLVLGRDGGAYPPLARAARAFLGGAAGSGRQGMSWIHLDDMLEVFGRAIAEPAMHGTYNACSPEPVENAEFMRALRHSVHRPWCPPAPGFVVSLVLRHLVRTEPDLVLEGQFVTPVRLLGEGFRFRYQRLPEALAELAGREPADAGQ